MAVFAWLQQTAAHSGKVAPWLLAGALSDTGDTLATWLVIRQGARSPRFIALSVLALLVLGAGPAEMGLLRAATFLPELLGLAVGVLVDRHRRKPLMVAADLARAIVLGSIPAAAVLGVLDLPQVYVVALLSGALTVVFGIAYTAYLPGLVATEDLLEGNRRLEISRTTSHAVGPALAGALVQTLSASVAILLDAASFVVSAVSLLLIHTPEPPRTIGGALPRPARAEILDGLRHLLADPTLRAVTLAALCWNLFSGGIFDALYVLYLTTDLGFTAADVAVLLTANGAAAVLGAVLSGRVIAHLGLGRAVIGTTLVVPPAVVAIALVRLLVAGPDQLVLVTLGALAVLVGVLSPTFGIAVVSIRQAYTPDPLRGRVTAAGRLISVGVVPIGALVGGALAQVVGAPGVLVVAGLGLFLVPVAFALSPVRRLQQLPRTT